MEEIQTSAKEALQRKIEEVRTIVNNHDFLPTRKHVEDAFGGDDTLWLRYNSDKGHYVYEMLTQEYVASLAQEVIRQFDTIVNEKEGPVVVLEVGAGNGRLTHFLQAELEKDQPGKFKVIATDSGEWSLKSDYEVELIDHRAALEKYKPDIVLQSWMPQGEDMTKDYRASESVKGYLLIGEEAVTGDSWETWGDTYYDESKKGEVPLYEADGFKKSAVDNLRLLQICRNDTVPGQPHGLNFHSSTVLFTK